MEKAGEKIVRLLHNSGHQAFFVGGAVRNHLLKLPSDNVDIATDALPDGVEEILNKARITNKPVGKKFGTILAIVQGEQVEITTFRRESRYSDARHPDRVEFIREYLDDARRRDLTINALYFNPQNQQLHDPTGGMKDLRHKLIRFVGDPRHRIDEDPLRMLRAVRLATQLGFKLEKNSFAAIKTRAKLIQDVSGERAKLELDKILLCPNRAAGLRLLEEVGLMKFLLPEFLELKRVSHNSKKFHLEGNVQEHTLVALTKTPAELDLLYAILFHDIGKIRVRLKVLTDGELLNRFYGHQQESKKIFEAFASKYKFSRESRELVSWLILHHDDRADYRTMTEETRFKYSLHPDFAKLVTVWWIDSASNLRLGEGGKESWGDSDSAKLGRRILQTIARKENLIRKFSRGEFIIHQANLKPGPKIGQIAERLKIKILLGEVNNESDAKNFLKKNH